VRDPPEVNTGFCRWLLPSARSILAGKSAKRAGRRMAALRRGESQRGCHAVKTSTSLTAVTFSVLLAGFTTAGPTLAVESGVRMQDAKVALQAQRSSTRQLNTPSHRYRPKPGYADSDAFIIEATSAATRLAPQLRY